MWVTITFPLPPPEAEGEGLEEGDLNNFLLSLQGSTQNPDEPEDKSGTVKKLKADSVVVSVGSIPENSLHDALKDKVKEIYTIGDAKEPGNIGAALRSATEVGVKM